MRLAGVLLVAALVTCAPIAYAQTCSPAACDLNQDGTAGNQTDYLVILQSFGKSAGDAGFDVRGDLDGDGAISPADWKIMAKFCPIPASGD